MVQSKSDFKRNFDAFVVEFARQIMRCSAFSFHGFRVFLRFSDFFIQFMCVVRCEPAPRAPATAAGWQRRACEHALPPPQA